VRDNELVKVLGTGELTVKVDLVVDAWSKWETLCFPSLPSSSGRIYDEKRSAFGNAATSFLDFFLSRLRPGVNHKVNLVPGREPG
jgi:hypothetical protein